jgi:hypothetical protein
MYKSLALVAIAVFLGSCIQTAEKKEVTDWKTINSENFTIELPSHMKEAKDLHDDAVVQYQNAIKEFYFIVIQESISSFHQALADAELEGEYSSDIDGYAKLVSDKFADNVDEMIKKTEMKKIALKGMDARYFESNAKVNGVDIHYHYGFVQGDTTYYQVLSWTVMGKEKKLNDTMLGILESFKEKK